jgi:3-methyladenine DNA glycosylase Mpg
VTEEADQPAAVLIRKIEPLSGRDDSLKSYGPGNLTKYLKIDRKYNNFELNGQDELFILDDGYRTAEIKTAERVGVKYAGVDAKKKWRFISCP